MKLKKCKKKLFGLASQVGYNETITDVISFSKNVICTNLPATENAQIINDSITKLLMEIKTLDIHFEIAKGAKSFV